MSHGFSRYSPDVSYTSVEKTRAPMSRNTIPVAMNPKTSSSVVLTAVPSAATESSAPSLRSFLRTMNAVANAQMYMSPYQRTSPRIGTPGKISGRIHDGYSMYSGRKSIFVLFPFSWRPG